MSITVMPSQAIAQPIQHSQFPIQQSWSPPPATKDTVVHYLSSYLIFKVSTSARTILPRTFTKCLTSENLSKTLFLQQRNPFLNYLLFLFTLCQLTLLCRRWETWWRKGGEISSVCSLSLSLPVFSSSCSLLLVVQVTVCTLLSTFTHYQYEEDVCSLSSSVNIALVAVGSRSPSLNTEHC